jgi:hypothetical protein
VRRSQFTISAAFVCHCAVGWLVQALQWPVGRAKATPTLLLRLLVRAAAQGRSLSAVVREAAEAPSAEAVRAALRAVLPADPNDLLPATTRALHSRLPKALRRRPRTMAVDWHLRPYYGTKDTPGTLRGQPKASTKTFFAYATLLVIRRGQTFTVGLTHVAAGEEQTAVLERLLGQAEAAGLRVKKLLLDRGFYAATTIQWLQGRAIPFVMPMLRRGRPARRKADCTGTERFFVRGRRGWDTYTWVARPRRGGRKQPAVSVCIDVCMAPRPRAARGRKGKRKGKRAGPLVYACHGVRGTPEEVARWYRRRFRIETSYRQLGQGLAATSSTDRVYRLLLVAIALVLRNVWVWLHGRYLAERGPQGRRLRLGLLPLATLLGWLVLALDKCLGIRPRGITVERRPAKAASGG